MQSLIPLRWHCSGRAKWARLRWHWKSAVATTLSILTSNPNRIVLNLLNPSFIFRTIRTGWSSLMRFTVPQVFSLFCVVSSIGDAEPDENPGNICCWAQPRSIYSNNPVKLWLAVSPTWNSPLSMSWKHVHYLPMTYGCAAVSRKACLHPMPHEACAGGRILFAPIWNGIFHSLARALRLKLCADSGPCWHTIREGCSTRHNLPATSAWMLKLPAAISIYSLICCSCVVCPPGTLIWANGSLNRPRSMCETVVLFMHCLIYLTRKLCSLILWSGRVGSAS